MVSVAAQTGDNEEVVCFYSRADVGPMQRGTRTV